MNNVDRRTFLGVAAGGAALAQQPASSPSSTAKSDIKLGCQSAPTTDAHLKYLARYGIRNICGYPEIADSRLYATVDELHRTLDLTAKNKISLDCIAPPFLESSHIDKEKHPAIMLAQSPERDRDIEAMTKLIQNCARVGIPSIKYNMSILGVLRTERTPGRGDAMYSTWRLKASTGREPAPPIERGTSADLGAGRESVVLRSSSKEAHPNPPLTRAGRVNADAAWERITYFLDRVMPVATEYKIRMACHPHDPGVPPEGYQGVTRVLGTVDGLKRFLSIQESPYHGLNFCQGTVSEMLADPGTEIFDVIRYFGTRGKIFNVHFRNIRGHRDDFQEVYPDEGDIDFVKAIRVYREIGYQYMLMPDHVPQAASDPSGLQSFAFCYGYIRGLIQASERMSAS